MSNPSRPVTRRLYHEDATLAEFEATLVERRPAPASTNHPPGHELLLDQTAFYATAGGQPHDVGRLASLEVVDVRDEDGFIWHRVVEAGALPLIGAPMIGAIDRDRRIDHTQQHTGQHVLSQAFIETSMAETVSFHLGVDSVTIDLSRGEVTPEQLVRAEQRANDIVMEDRPIIIHWTTTAEIHRFPLRKPPVVEGDIRIVEIEGYDWSACGGTHVASTGRIGPIKILGTTSVKQGVRVEFVCGRRALTDYAWKHELIRGTAARFSTLGKNLGASIERLEEEHREARRRLKILEEDRLDREAAEILATCAAAADGQRIVQLERPGLAMDDLKALALRLRAHPGVLVLLAAPGSDGSTALVFARADDRIEDMGRAMKTTLAAVGGKGGGRPEMAQGQTGTTARIEDLWQAAREVLVVG
ncbi:MAG: DHHA1 domain-containing protein [Candidatus Eisenbacteria bacterium]|nr:DHHA1 domain-containing protein [Candidatus Eisenbacteria bacterium]